MPAKTRPYLFYDVAISICPHCYERVDAKILIQNGRVLLRRWCPKHGGTTAMISGVVVLLLVEMEKVVRRRIAPGVRPGGSDP